MMTALTYENSLLEDVWGDDEETENHRDENTSSDATFSKLVKLTNSPHGLRAQPSDLPALHRVHFTAGYRDGITAAKASSVQPGFDEGFGLGAMIGLRAGQLLGLLEGLAAAASANYRSGSADAAAATIRGGDQGDGCEREATKAEFVRLKGLLDEARKELCAKAVFASHYLAPDGTWLYALPGLGAGEDNAPPARDAKQYQDVTDPNSSIMTGSKRRTDTEAQISSVVFYNIAVTHPLMHKWSATMDEVAAHWGVDLEPPVNDRAVEKEANEEETRIPDTFGQRHLEKDKEEEARPAVSGGPKEQGALVW